LEIHAVDVRCHASQYLAGIANNRDQSYCTSLQTDTQTFVGMDPERESNDTHIDTIFQGHNEHNIHRVMSSLQRMDIKNAGPD